VVQKKKKNKKRQCPLKVEYPEAVGKPGKRNILRELGFSVKERRGRVQPKAKKSGIKDAKGERVLASA